jgi:hypothetical protein
MQISNRIVVSRGWEMEETERCWEKEQGFTYVSCVTFVSLKYNVMIIVSRIALSLFV